MTQVDSAPDGIDVAATGTDSSYLTPTVGLVALAFWLVVPLLVGYVRFNGSDL